MNKVILTQKQAKIIEETKSALAGFSNKILVRCLNGEYEVEPEYSKGDWVVTKVTNHVGQITGYSEISKDYEVDDDIMTDCLRHATPEEIAKEKERRWWSGHGRKVWELRKGDILINAKDEEDISVVIGFDVGGLLKLHSLTGDYINRLPINEVNYDRFRVLCFAENRLDVKDDE